MILPGGNGPFGRDACARCGRTEGVEPFEYHAYREVTSHGELPKGLKEIGNIFQGRSVYHGLVQLSAMICARCVWGARLWRGLLFAAAAALLAAAAVPLWMGHQAYMERFTEARDAMDQLDVTEHPEKLAPELRNVDDARLQERIFVEEQGRLQREKDRALLYAVPLRLGSAAAMFLALGVLGWAAWELRWERVGQRVAAVTAQAECRKQGLKHVRPGHLAGGRVVGPD